MTEPTDPGTTPDATATEALPLADQQPVAPAAAVTAPMVSSTPVAAAPSRGHTRTILEAVGAVVAVVMILAAGAFGFVVGHVTGSDNGRWGMMTVRHDVQDGSGGGGLMRGQREQGRGQGQDGLGPWDQGQGLGQGQQGPWGQAMPGMPGIPGMPGQDPRGTDPDGDNWTGGQGALPGQPLPTLPSSPAQPTVPSSPAQPS